MSEGLMTPPELMRLMGWKHASQVTRAVKHGLPSFMLPGSGRRFRRSEVEAWLEGCRENPAPPVARIVALREAS